MVEFKTFKKIIGDFLITKGFSKKGSYYYLIFEELIIAVGLQKSNFSNSYYINIGYIISKLNPDITTPRDVDGDVRARFFIEKDGKQIDIFELEKLSGEEELKIYLGHNIEHYITNVKSIDNLKSLLKENPVLLYQTKFVAKVLMGFQ